MQQYKLQNFGGILQLKMKPKLTPKEQEEKKARQQLLYIQNRVRSEWAHKHLTTFRDLYIAAGISPQEIDKKYFPSELNKILTFEDVKEYLSDRQVELDTFYWLEKNPPDTEPDIITEQPLVTDKQAIVEDLIDQVAEEKKIIDYGLEHCSLEKAFLFWFQKKATKELLDKIRIKRKRSVYVIAGTGTGKTFIAGAFFARLVESKFHVGKTLSPWPYVYITKASVVEQTKRVFEKFFGLTENDVLITNYDQLRSSFGSRFVNFKTIVEHGEDKEAWEWRKGVFPIVVLWDEGHSLKNEGSQQSKIAQSYNEIDSEYTSQVFMSATPMTRVADAKCFVVGSRVPYTFGMLKYCPMNNNHWPDFARNIANNYGSSDITPLDHSPAAMERLMNYMDDYIIRVKGVKAQFHARNKVELISFETEEGRKFYDTALERFLAEKAKAESNVEMSDSQKNICILTALLVFRIAAESNPDRVRIIARRMWRAVQEGKAAVAALNFKISIVKIVQVLINDFNVSRDKISLIWGGAAAPSKRLKLKTAINSNTALNEALANAGISLKDLDLDKIESYEEEQQNLDPALRLGTQSRKERQREIDRFQRGDSLYCLYTFRAGGVGLSLHHTDECTKEKVRHKESGYAFEEDIPNIPTRQRVNFVAPTYSAIELVQGLGRCPRLTSLSDTVQILLFFHGTIEVKVAMIVSMKLRSLGKVVRQREDWADVILGGMSDEEIEEKHIKDHSTEEVKAIAGEDEPNDESDEGIFEEDDEE